MYREVSRPGTVIYRFQPAPLPASDSNLVCRSNVYTLRVLSFKADEQRDSSCAKLRPSTSRNVLFELALEAVNSFIVCSCEPGSLLPLGLHYKLPGGLNKFGLLGENKIEQLVRDSLTFLRWNGI